MSGLKNNAKIKKVLYPEKDAGKCMIQFCKKSFLFFLLWASVCVPRANLTVKDIQVGTEIKKTRIVFVLSHPISLYVESSEDGSLLVKAPEDTFWKIPEQKQAKQGALIQYDLMGFGSRRACHLILEPYTRLVGSFLRGKTYILDLITDDPPLPEPEPEEQESELNALPPEPPQPTTVNIQQTLELPKNEINALIITPKEDGTTWILINSDKQDFFESQIVPETRKLYLYLPKINWPSMQTEVIDSGSVQSYAVDESVPGSSTIMMDLKENTDTIDLVSTPNLDGTYDFVLILANRKATDAETKKLAEKRVELKSVVGASKAMSFKINSPQLVPEVGEIMAVDQPSAGGGNTEDLLFDPAEFIEKKQEPDWVSEARSQLEEK
ncbi:MAG: hypothetical protein A2977_01915 [Alphaproteobacteria bacterium RIFCSPLOWO2_01_FULL_45_8]|nr:MAG: hypothetical protein A3K20_02370 [Alphaproteobacteria bacterium GWA1_45_9]OFW89387.1 MAG: hypothetical protein A2621_00420 [Alphaproteobacteria bacterium RIFCSPHIGHO2_01_FULL_41_14]OFW96340.1 MAG: hypothetical protein A2977_01915 [Alphaproteobacteria bacterium RIFCSPLOWO2_01_FULL_45_8]HCI48738.1 hypothetical protein [Holosporales bacterium]